MTDNIPSTDRAWWRTDEIPAPEGIIVDTKISDIGGDRNHQRLFRKGRLWFFDDGSDHRRHEFAQAADP